MKWKFKFQTTVIWQGFSVLHCIMLYIAYCTGPIRMTEGSVDNWEDKRIRNWSLPLGYVKNHCSIMEMIQPDWEQPPASEGFHVGIIGSYTHLLSISLLLWVSDAHWSLPTLKLAVQARVWCWMFSPSSYFSQTNKQKKTPEVCDIEPRCGVIG